MAFHRKRTILGDEILQIGIVNPLKQLLKGSRSEISQHQQHPLAGAQAHVGLRQRPHIAGKQHPAVLHANIF